MKIKYARKTWEVSEIKAFSWGGNIKYYYRNIVSNKIDITVLVDANNELVFPMAHDWPKSVVNFIKFLNTKEELLNESKGPLPKDEVFLKWQS